MRDDGLQVQPQASEVVRVTTGGTLAARPTAARRLRLWPACLIVVAQWLVLTVPGWFWPGTQLQLDCMVWGRHRWRGSHRTVVAGGEPGALDGSRPGPLDFCRLRGGIVPAVAYQSDLSALRA